MRKEKKSSKRLTKKQLAEKLMSFFQTQPDETFSFKQIFHALKLTTHPAKMLAIDVMEELAWDDFLSKVGESAYTLNTKGQVQEGTFIRKAMVRIHSCQRMVVHPSLSLSVILWRL